MASSGRLRNIYWLQSTRLCLISCGHGPVVEQLLRSGIDAIACGRDPRRALRSEEELETSPEAVELPCPGQAEEDDDKKQRESDAPKDPLVQLHVADVVGVHAEDPCHGAER